MDKRTIGLGCRIVAGILAGAVVVSQGLAARAQPSPPSPAPAAPAKPAPAAAAAKPDLAAAKKHYADGEKKYKAGDYAGALADFQTANDIKDTPQAERYLGLCEDALGHYASAADWYDKFLSHVPDKMATQGDEIRKRYSEIKTMPGKVHVDSNPPGASVSIDDKPATAQTPTDVELAAGSHTLKLTEAGRLPAQKQIDVGFASTQTVSVDLEPEPPAPAPPPPVASVPPPAPPPSPPPPAPEPRSKVPAYVTGALAVAAAGVGTVFGVIALGDKSTFDKNPTTHTADNGDTHALIADMSFGVALTFGVTSAVLFLTRDETPATTPPTASATAARTSMAKETGVTLTPVPVVGPHAGGAGLALRF